MRKQFDEIRETLEDALIGALEDMLNNRVIYAINLDADGEIYYTQTTNPEWMTKDPEFKIVFNPHDEQWDEYEAPEGADVEDWNEDCALYHDFSEELEAAEDWYKMAG